MKWAGTKIKIPFSKKNVVSLQYSAQLFDFLLIAICTVKSRAVDRSTIQFLTTFGVLLTETSY